ncbi:MAG: hypothetical protein NZ519_06495 [Bacteroidia bacterium]|nr:hypothetical protein [Bacteroidia bacterium]
MRHAKGKPLGLVRSPSPTLLLLPRGWAGGAQHRSESVARSTPTLPTQAQATCGQGHAQKKDNLYRTTANLLTFLCPLSSSA